MARTPDEFDPDELDARWNDLTSRLGPLGVPREGEHPEKAGGTGPVPTSPPGPRGHEVPDDETGFEEPDPVLGHTDPATVLGWLALGLGILGVFMVFATRAATILGVLSTAVAVSGLISLVVRLPQHANRDDDGAQV